MPRLFVPVPVILPDFELIQLFPPDSKHQNQITLPKIDTDSLHGLFLTFVECDYRRQCTAPSFKDIFSFDMILAQIGHALQLLVYDQLNFDVSKKTSENQPNEKYDV